MWSAVQLPSSTLRQWYHHKYSLRLHMPFETPVEPFCALRWVSGGSLLGETKGWSAQKVAVAGGLMLDADK